MTDEEFDLTDWREAVPGSCWMWHGIHPDHQMRCRRPYGHSGKHDNEGHPELLGEYASTEAWHQRLREGHPTVPVGTRYPCEFAPGGVEYAGFAAPCVRPARTGEWWVGIKFHAGCTGLQRRANGPWIRCVCPCHKVAPQHREPGVVVHTGSTVYGILNTARDHVFRTGEQIVSADDPRDRTFGFQAVGSEVRWSVPAEAVVFGECGTFDLYGDTEVRQLFGTPAGRMLLARVVSTGQWEPIGIISRTDESSFVLTPPV